ncbi:MAG TPA: hypothetical protein VK207_10820, partial [Bacteroidales bacterium]|nr:hypothetical protein [Bacteroidales bacterium]
TLIPEDLSFVYRLGYQTTISGHSPFFYQSQLITSLLTGATSEGLGGASSLRGVMRNRVIGDGFFFGNLELRWKPIRFVLAKQDIYIGLNAFYDMGIITDRIDIPAGVETIFGGYNEFFDEHYSDYFKPGGEKLHQSAGISIMPVLNQNFVIAVDIGKALNEQDGNIGFSIGLNYLF